MIVEIRKEVWKITWIGGVRVHKQGGDLWFIPPAREREIPECWPAQVKSVARKLFQENRQLRDTNRETVVNEVNVYDDGTDFTQVGIPCAFAGRRCRVTYEDLGPIGVLKRAGWRWFFDGSGAV